MKSTSMKWFLSLFIACAAMQIQAQGLVEKFDEGCNCYIITNHFDNGQVSSIHHENVARKRDGIATTFGEDGKVQREERWLNGKLNGTTTHYHNNGAIYLEAYYENGKKTGTWKFLDLDGTPSQEITYNGNGSDGIYGLYYGGVKYVEQTIEHGKLVDTKILHQELYDAVREEASQTSK